MSSFANSEEIADSWSIGIIELSALVAGKKIMLTMQIFLHNSFTSLSNDR